MHFWTSRACSSAVDEDVLSTEWCAFAVDSVQFIKKKVGKVRSHFQMSWLVLFQGELPSAIDAAERVLPEGVMDGPLNYGRDVLSGLDDPSAARDTENSGMDREVQEAASHRKRSSNLTEAFEQGGY